MFASKRQFDGWVKPVRGCVVDPSPTPSPEPSTSFPTPRSHAVCLAQGLLLQLWAMNWSLLLRRQGPKWYGPEFSALHYTLLNPFAGGTAGKGLCVWSHTGAHLCRVLTGSSLLVELLAPSVGAVVSATTWWRVAATLSLTLYHGGLYVLTELRLLPLVSAAVGLVYVPSSVWDLWPATREPWEDGKDKPRRARADHGGAAWADRLAVAMLSYALYTCLADLQWLPRVDRRAVGALVRFDQGWDAWGPDAATRGHFWAIFGRPPAQKGRADTGYDMMRWVKDGTWELANNTLDLPAVPALLHRNFRWERYLHDAVADAGRLGRRARRLGLWLCWAAEETLGVDWGEVQIVVREVTVDRPFSPREPPFKDLHTFYNVTFSCSKPLGKAPDADGDGAGEKGDPGSGRGG